MKQWSESRLKNLLAIPLSYGLNVSSEDDREDWPRYIRITDFDDFDHLNEGTFKSLPISVAEPALLKDGDLLFARCGATAGKTFLYSALPKGACYAGYLIRARFKRNLVNPRFVSYFTKGVDYCNWKNRYCIQTTIQNISADKYNQLPISIPSLSEQQRIVDYLDEKLAKIDERIEVLEKQQDAYARLKKSVIHQAVTRGLDPDVRLKDSGIEWIGMIPEHWEVKRVKDVCNVVCGATPKDNTSYWDGNIIWISPADMPEFGELTEGARTITEQGYQSCGTSLVPAGSIVMSTRAPIGKTNIAVNELCTNQGCKCLTSKKLKMKFMLYCIASKKEQFQALGRGTTFIELSTKDLSLFLFAVPPIPEQQAIANYLDEKCAKIDAAIENIGKQIDASKRLKRALINEVITGQRAV